MNILIHSCFQSNYSTEGGLVIFLHFTSATLPASEISLQLQDSASGGSSEGFYSGFEKKTPIKSGLSPSFALIFDVSQIIHCFGNGHRKNSVQAQFLPRLDFLLAWFLIIMNSRSFLLFIILVCRSFERFRHGQLIFRPKN